MGGFTRAAHAAMRCGSAVLGLQIVRDWVVRFNAEGSDGLIDRKAPGRPGEVESGSASRPAGLGVPQLRDREAGPLGSEVLPPGARRSTIVKCPGLACTGTVDRDQPYPRPSSLVTHQSLCGWAHYPGGPSRNPSPRSVLCRLACRDAETVPQTLDSLIFYIYPRGV